VLARFRLILPRKVKVVAEPIWLSLGDGCERVARRSLQDRSYVTLLGCMEADQAPQFNATHAR
jgi:hypothetical protein